MRLASQIFFEILARNQNSIQNLRVPKWLKTQKLRFFLTKKRILSKREFESFF